MDRDRFLRTLLRELSGALQEIVGLEEASGYISIVGAAVGDDLDRTYRAALKVERLSRAQVTQALVDLKRRIGGDFYVLEEHADHVVLGNRACPFGRQVEGRPALCMMTSNVFGNLTARNLGYARVRITQAIAMGDPQCRVTVFFTPGEGDGTDREYFRPVEPELTGG